VRIDVSYPPNSGNPPSSAALMASNAIPPELGSMTTLWLVVTIGFTVVALCLRWSIERDAKNKTNADRAPFDEVGRMKANRKEYTRINREAMEAWEDACDCRPPESKDEAFRREIREATERVKWEASYYKPFYSGIFAPPLTAPPRMPQYVNPTSPFNDWLRQHYSMQNMAMISQSIQEDHRQGPQRSHLTPARHNRAGYGRRYRA
jgi:hypothetical protein